MSSEEVPPSITATSTHSGHTAPHLLTSAQHIGQEILASASHSALIEAFHTGGSQLHLQSHQEQNPTTASASASNTNTTIWDSLLASLPHALMTRRRYSAFRPMPPPKRILKEEQISQSNNGTGIINSTELHSFVLQKDNSGTFGAQMRGHSDHLDPKDILSRSMELKLTDLEKFLKTRRHAKFENKSNSIKAIVRRITPHFSIRIKDKIPLIIVIFLGLMTICQFITFVYFISMPEFNLTADEMLRRCMRTHLNHSVCYGNWTLPRGKLLREPG